MFLVDYKDSLDLEPYSPDYRDYELNLYPYEYQKDVKKT